MRRGEAPDLVEHDICRGIAFQLDNHANAGAAGFIADIGDTLNPFVLGRFGNFFDQTGFADLEGDRRQDDRAFVAASFLDHMARAHHDRSATILISSACAGLPQYQRCCREIGAGDDFDQLVDSDSRIFDIGEAGVDHFA